MNLFAADTRNNPKNHAQMLVIHGTPKIKKKQSKTPLRSYRPRPSSPTTMVRQNFLRIEKGRKKHDEASPGQPRHVKKRRRIGLLIEPLPRQIAGRHNHGTMRVVACTDTVMELKQQHNHKDPPKALPIIVVTSMMDYCGRDGERTLGSAHLDLHTHTCSAVRNGPIL